MSILPTLPPHKVIAKNLSFKQAMGLMVKPVDNVILSTGKITLMFRTGYPNEVLGYFCYDNHGTNIRESNIVIFALEPGGTTVQLFDEDEIDHSLIDWVVVESDRLPKLPSKRR